MRNYDFKNTNVFQVERDLANTQRLPVSIRCPHCRHLGSFHVARELAISFAKAATNGSVVPLYASVRICPNLDCVGLVFVIEDHLGVLAVEPPELLDFDPQGLPARCEATLKEAVACHGVGAYRAAAMMVRRLLEEICEENAATGKDLHNRLKQLRTKIVLPEALFGAMNELKALGNDAAHIEAKVYDNIDQGEAADSIELAKEILKSLYQLQGLLGRLQARKKPGGATP